MSLVESGFPTHHTGVEAWELDHNAHWNVRYYLRSFQAAAQVTAAMAGTDSPPAGDTWHYRFHRELADTSPVEVRSAAIADGPFAGAVVHALTSNCRLSATAFDQSGTAAATLPTVSAEQAKLALPRGIDGTPHAVAEEAVPSDARVVEHGLVQPAELDHGGNLAMDQLMKRISTASRDMLNHLGFTREFIREHGVSRMNVETKLTRHAPCGVGVRLRGVARLITTSRKSFILQHQLFQPGIAHIATVEHCLVTVDLSTRRAVELPDFLRGRLADMTELKSR